MDLQAISGIEMVLMNIFLVSSSELSVNQYIPTVNVWVVTKASTYDQFHRHPERRELNPF